MRHWGWLLLLVPLAGCACRPPFRVAATADANVNVKAKVEAPPAKMAGPLCEMAVVREGNRKQKIALIDVDGVLLNQNHIGLYSAGENPVDIFRERLDTIEHSKQFQAVILRINSPGGGVTATDMMVRDLAEFKRRTGLPVVAVIMEVGTGGAYLLAAQADQVIAHPTSITGSLGVIINVFDLQTSLGNAVTNLSVKVGDYVEIGSPLPRIEDDTSLDDFRTGQKEILLPMAESLHARLKTQVTARRPKLDGNLKETFDGRIFASEQALSLGLIDQIGYIDDAIDSARSLSGCTQGCVIMLHRAQDPARTPYAITPNDAVGAAVFPSLPGLDRSRLPQFLYMWQPDPTLAVRK